MEGLKIRSFVVAGLMAVTAAWAAVSSRPQIVKDNKDEKWMKQVAPVQFDSFRFEPHISNDAVDDLESYHSSKMVYDTLQPTVGILARVYDSGTQRYDVTLIASRDRASFHDPRVCFTAQGYEIVDEQSINIPTKTRGIIPVTLAKMKSDQGTSLAIFFYRGPAGFYGTTMSLKWSLWFDQLAGKAFTDAVFYRFVALGDGDQDRLISFVGNYMDAAGKSSRNYF